jgi:hypoxanthine phosphoribosyltransferase
MYMNTYIHTYIHIYIYIYIYIYLYTNLWKIYIYLDDLVATGGTLIAACDLLASVGATIVECACMVELKMLGGYKRLQEKHADVKVYMYVYVSVCIYM